METARYLMRQGWEATFAPVDHEGTVDVDAYAAAFRPDTRLASVMFANNVVGTVQPIKELARIAQRAPEMKQDHGVVGRQGGDLGLDLGAEGHHAQALAAAVSHEHGAAFHTDAVQAVGAMPIDVDDLGVDLLSLSGHKLYGPKGIGALYIRRATRVAPILHGGGHERRLRSGTENVPGIVGLGAALTLAVAALPTEGPRLVALRDRLTAGLLASIEDTVNLGHPSARLPGNVCVSVAYIEGESMVLQLDAKGIAVSSGSACASGSLEPSHVILGMGYRAEEAHGSVRLTLGRENSDADADYFLEVFPPIVARLREMSPLYVKR